MAVTKLLALKARVDNRIKYICNAEKTEHRKLISIYFFENCYRYEVRWREKERADRRLIFHATVFCNPIFIGKRRSEHASSQ